METHSSILVWRIPRMGEPGRLQSMGSQGVRHHWVTHRHTHTHTHTHTVSRMEKEMATHPSTLAWRIPWTREPDGLQSMGSQRVRHDWATHTHTYTHTHTHTHTHTLYHLASFWILSTLRHEELEFLRESFSPDAFFPVSEGLEQALTARPVTEHPDPMQ